MIDDRLPVLVGVGQTVHHAAGITDAWEPADLMAESVLRASADAGLGAVPAPDALRVVSLFSWRYGNPAKVVARRLGVEARHYGYGTVGGNSPQSMLNATAAAIQRSDLDVAILTGAEAWRTRMRAKRDEVVLDWEKDDSEPEVIGEELDMNMPAEIERGIVMPVQVYPMFETAIRAEAGHTVEQHRRHISELWAAMSRVAAGNEFAWSREDFTAEQLATPSDDNRMIGLPYPKRLNSNNDVDMGAALIVCSARAARRLGVPTDRWVFLHAGSESHEHPYVSHRWEFSRTPAIEIGGQRALDLAGAGIDDIALIDLYSCFPSATQLGARSLRIGLDRPLTLTGGMAFAGGPWNNYVMHAIATMVSRLRERLGELGLVWGNGGYVTKHSFGVYGNEPPAGGFRLGLPQAEIDALPRRALATPAEAAGAATVEAYTVMFDRAQQPELAIASCLLADGRRAWATSTAADVSAAMTDGEWVGVEVSLGSDAVLHV